jgi:F-type H+-transporting ATPase subunit epsilon
MQISVLTPDHRIFRGDIASVKVPGTNGEFQVLKNHAPIVSSLDAGKVEIVAGTEGYELYDEEKKLLVAGKENGYKLIFTIDGGFIEVLNNEISLLVQGARNLR